MSLKDLEGASEAPDEELREPLEDVKENDEEFDRDIQEENEFDSNNLSSSQGSKIQENSGSLYKPSQESVGNCSNLG